MEVRQQRADGDGEARESEQWRLDRGKPAEVRQRSLDRENYTVEVKEQRLDKKVWAVEVLTNGLRHETSDVHTVAVHGE